MADAEFVDRFLKTRASGDYEALAQMMSPEVVWTVAGEAELARSYRGREEVLGLFRTMNALFEEDGASYAYVPLDRLYGERFAALVMDRSASGRGSSLEDRVVVLLEIGEGELVSARFLSDQTAAADRLYSLMSEGAEDPSRAAAQAALDALARWDIDAYERLLAEDAVEGRPQLGEEFVGRADIAGMYRAVPSAPNVEWWEISGGAGEFTGRGAIHYGDSWDHLVATLRIENGHVKRADFYFASQLDYDIPYHAPYSRKVPLRVPEAP